MTTPSSKLLVGQSATIGCSSDLDLNNITWYEINSALSEEEYEEGKMVVQNTTRVNSTSNSSAEIQMLLNPVSTNHEGKVFRCEANSPYGSQERSITLSTYGNDII